MGVKKKKKKKQNKKKKKKTQTSRIRCSKETPSVSHPHAQTTAQGEEKTVPFSMHMPAKAD